MKRILSRSMPDRTTDQVRRILPDIKELRAGLLSYKQIVVELKKEYQVTITPADDPRKAAKKLAAIIWKIEHAKKRVPQETILVPGDEETSHAARAVPGSEDAKAHGMKVLEDARRKLEESKKSIFARANREES